MATRPTPSHNPEETNPPPAPAFNVVLVAPEIPQNTGSIARLCAATYTRLHLIKPLGFSLEDRYLKRAGLDYWPWVDLHVYETWADFRRTHALARLHLFSARAERSYLEARYRGDDFLVFGRETKGLPADLLNAHEDDTYVIPIDSPNVRSLNLANAVSIVLYEARRQNRGVPGACPE